MLKITLGLFLIAHGLIHASYGSPKPPEGPVSWPFDLSHSWVLSPLGLGEAVTRPLGTVLWVGATLFTVMAGLGILGVPGLQQGWRGLAIAGAVASLLLLGIYFHYFLTLGVLINVAIIASLLWANWPSEQVVGA